MVIPWFDFDLWLQAIDCVSQLLTLTTPIINRNAILIQETHFQTKDYKFFQEQKIHPSIVACYHMSNSNNSLVLALATIWSITNSSSNKIFIYLYYLHLPLKRSQETVSIVTSVRATARSNKEGWRQSHPPIYQKTLYKPIEKLREVGW